MLLFPLLYAAKVIVAAVDNNLMTIPDAEMNVARASYDYQDQRTVGLFMMDMDNPVVEVILRRDGNNAWFECDCPMFQTREEGCRHCWVIYCRMVEANGLIVIPMNSEPTEAEVESATSTEQGMRDLFLHRSIIEVL